MKRAKLGDLDVSAIGLGCMSMSSVYGKADEEESEATLRRAVELGVTFFDTANGYGRGHNERLIGRVLGAQRDKVQISTKFGFMHVGGTPYVDGHPDRIEDRCDESLERLGTYYIDLYFLHRPDPNVPIEETVGGMAKLVEKGKVRHIGICEVSAKSLRKAHAVHPIAAVQSEYSLWTRDVEAHVLPACRELGVGFVPFSPIGRAILTGAIKSGDQIEEKDMRSTMPRFQGDNLSKNLQLVGQLEEIASSLSVKPGQIALAWLLSKGDNIVPIPGTKRRKYLEENAAAADIVLPSSVIEQLDAIFDAEKVVGGRYGFSWMETTDKDD